MLDAMHKNHNSLPGIGAKNSRHGNGVLKKIIKDKWIYVALLPSIAFLVVFMIYPVYEAITKSFFDWKMSSFVNPEFIGFQNYIDILKDGLFWKSFGILLIFILWGFVTTMFFVVPVTYLVFKLGEGGAGRFFQRAYVIPMMVPTMVLTLFWKFFYEPNFGMLNNILNMVGKENWTHVWLGEKGYAVLSLLFMGFPWVSGFGFLVILAGFQGIDKSLHESAEIDGANSIHKFSKIDIPLIIPQLKILIMLGMIAGIQQFQNQMIMTNGGPDYSTYVPGLLMYKNAFAYGNLGYGSAIGVLLFIIILGFSIFANTKIKKAD